MDEDFFLDTLSALGIGCADGREVTASPLEIEGNSYVLSRGTEFRAEIVIHGGIVSCEQAVAWLHALRIDVEAFYAHVWDRKTRGDM